MGNFPRTAPRIPQPARSTGSSRNQRWEIDRAELAVDAGRAWEAIRAPDLAQSPFVRILFGLRTLPDRLTGHSAPLRLRLDDLVSTPDRPGFQLLAEDAPREVAAGAIGKVWQPVIPFVHVPDAAAFAAFSERGYIKVAWALPVIAENERTSRVEFEVRVSATDDKMQTAQLRHLAERAEGRNSSSGVRDLVESVGAAVVAALKAR